MQKSHNYHKNMCILYKSRQTFSFYWSVGFSQDTYIQIFLLSGHLCPIGLHMIFIFIDQLGNGHQLISFILQPGDDSF